MVTTDRIDGVQASVALKAPVRVASTANVTLSGTQTIDGVAVVVDDRVLLKDQTDGTENGVYDVSATAWTRAKDWDGARDIVSGTRVFINLGSAGAGKQAVITTTGALTIGTTSLAFSLLTSVDATIAADLAALEPIKANITTVAGISANVTTVAGISANVTTVAADGTDIGVVAGDTTVINTVAGIAANVTTVAGISANVTTVTGIAANVTTVAGIAANVTTVAGVAANVTTVAGIAANVTTVAGNSANVTTVAGISANVTTVAGVAANVSAVAAMATGWNFDSATTMADPGNGDLRMNNGTVSSVTAIAVDDLDAGGTDRSAFVVTWDDSSSTNKGTLIITDGTSGAWAIFSVTGLTDNSGWTQLAVTYVATAGSFSNADKLYVTFSRTGDVAESASTTVSGIVELATTAEVNTGSDSTRAITPAGLTAWTGDTALVTVGTIGTGTWQGTAINQTYLTGQSGTNTGDEAVADATTSGTVELATTDETETGTDAGRAVTPDGLHDMTTLSGAAWMLDEDAMGSDSATVVASQQSIKAYVDALGVTSSGSPTFTGLTTTGHTQRSLATGLTAGTTQTMAGALALTKDINIVTVNGNDDDGVALPTAVAGKEVTIINSDAAQRLQVWPGNGFSDTIDGGSANAVDANKLAAGAVRTYVADGSTNWVTTAVELTTDAEAIAGTDSTRAVVSSALQAKTNKIGVHVYVAGGGSADVATLTVVPAITAYVTGARFLFLPTADNTGACTLNVSGLGAKNIKKSDGAGALANPAAADLDTVLVADVIYDGTQFVLQNPGVAAGGADFDTAITFNESGNDVDFRFEGENNQNLLNLDGAKDAISIGGAIVDGSALNLNNLTIRTALTDVGFQMNVPTQTQPFNGGGRTITWGSSVGIQAQTFTNDSGTLTMTNPQALYVQACVAGTNVTATNGPYAIYANGVSRLTGIQIDDPASTMSHYHEGTWTPTLDFHTTPGSHTYDSRSGYYIQIGSLVVASFQVVLTNLASCSGIAGIKDLPKPVKVVTNISWSGHLGYHSGITSNTNKDFIVMIAGPSDGQFRLYENGIGGTASITDADFANDSRLSGTLIYNTGS